MTSDMTAANRQAGARATQHDDDTLLEWDGAPSECQNTGPAFHARTYLVDRAFARLRPRRLVDIGCGRGYVTAIAAKHARTVIATDLSPEAVRNTAALLVQHPDARALTADAFGGEPPFTPGAFDAVLLSEVLEHLDDDAGALAGCHRLLEPGGHLVLTVPGNPALWTKWDDLAGHRRRYTRNELIGKLYDAAFDVRTITNWGFPLTGWLAIRGAGLRGRRVSQRNAGGEVPSLIRQLMPAASIVFRAAARIEPLFSSLDRGAGYVVLARRR
jgi:SAM-dependent methyltransferase